jgi:drug/metabolite transporter (DMT)-like permease
VAGPGRRFHGLALIALLTLLWGVNWPLLKLALTEVAPFTLRALCVTVGGAALLALATATGQRVAPHRREALALAAMALINVTLWQMLSAWGVERVASGRAAILAYTMPVWGVALGALFLHEPIDRPRVLGLALGMAGMALLVGDDALAIGHDATGALLMVAASVSWAVGTVIAKGFPWSVSLSAMVGWQLLGAAPPLIAGALILEPTHWAMPGPGPLLAASYTVIVATIVCHWLWFRILALFPAGIAAISVLMIPVVGLLSGAALLGEPLGWLEAAALVLVLGALAAVHLPGLRPRPRTA